MEFGPAWPCLFLVIWPWASDVTFPRFSNNTCNMEPMFAPPGRIENLMWLCQAWSIDVFASSTFSLPILYGDNIAVFAPLTSVQKFTESESIFKKIRKVSFCSTGPFRLEFPENSGFQVTPSLLLNISSGEAKEERHRVLRHPIKS